MKTGKKKSQTIRPSLPTELTVFCVLYKSNAECVLRNDSACGRRAKESAFCLFLAHNIFIFFVHKMKLSSRHTPSSVRYSCERHWATCIEYRWANEMERTKRHKIMVYWAEGKQFILWRWQRRRRRHEQHFGVQESSRWLYKSQWTRSTENERKRKKSNNHNNSKKICVASKHISTDEIEFSLRCALTT